MLIYSLGFLSYAYKHQTEKRRPTLSVGDLDHKITNPSAQLTPCTAGTKSKGI